MGGEYAYERAQAGAKPTDKNESCITGVVLAQFADWHLGGRPTLHGDVCTRRRGGVRAGRTSEEDALGASERGQ